MASKLSGREKDFCSCFLKTGNAQKSAELAGFCGDTRAVGDKLLQRQDILSEIADIAQRQEKILSGLATAGYIRLAFGSIADAVSLLYLDKPSRDELEKMDLFLVSEIKHPKDGAVEIKFFDRLKALEKLSANRGSDDSTDSIFDAICNSAKQNGGSKSED